MTKSSDREKKVIREAEDIVGRKLDFHNHRTEGCVTTRDIAKTLFMETSDLNSFLCDKGILRWQGGRYRLTPKYEGKGLAEVRLFVYYSKDGKQKERTYLVWTPEGYDMIKRMIH